jgi:hypothetical protein
MDAGGEGCLVFEGGYLGEDGGITSLVVNLVFRLQHAPRTHSSRLSTP